MLRHPFASLLLAVLLVHSAAAIASGQVFATREGAIRGYDAVAYFTEGRAVTGQAGIRHEWNGATWHFATVANRDAFARDPEHYAPQYGGYCAYGTANGYKVSTTPDAFAIRDGKLFLNYNAAVARTWNKNQPGYITKANDNWPALRDEPYVSDEDSTAGR